MRLVSCYQLWGQTISKFFGDKCPRLGAALAFYGIFSASPLLVFSVILAEFILGKEAVEGQLQRELSQIMGPDAAEALQTLLVSASRERSTGLVSSIVGIAVLLFGGAGVFLELQDAMNTIWDVDSRQTGTFRSMIRVRILSVVMILGSACLLLVLIVVSTALAAWSATTSFPTVGLQTADLLISALVTTFVFAMIFKYMPDRTVCWADVWRGALLSAVLFTFGKSLFGLYLGRLAIASSYGAAGALIVVLLWAYYSSQILLLGAEFTRVYALLASGDGRSADSHINPARGHP